MLIPRLVCNIRFVKISLFQFFGTLGFVLGTTLGIYLTLHQHLPLWVLALMSGLGAFQLFAHTMIHKIITGEETLVYYRHEIGIMALCAFVLWCIGQPAKSFLDISLLGVGVFLGFGRMGCYNVGCCHGRPCKVGVKYAHEHVEAGFPFYFENIKIFPLPLVESFFVFVTVIVGVWFMLNNYPSGTALIWYTVFYGGVRFVLEFFRGDPERPYWQGFSEAQWTTLILFIFTAVLSWMGWLPFYYGHFVAIGVLVGAMLFIFLYRRLQETPVYQITTPRHVREIAIGLHGVAQLNHEKDLFQGNPVIPIANTSLGIHISSGTIGIENGQLIHYTVSANSHTPKISKTLVVNHKVANAIGKLIQTLRHNHQSFQIQEGQSGIYHIIFTERF